MNFWPVGRSSGQLGGSLVIPVEVWFTCLWNSANTSIFSNHTIYDVFQLYLGTCFLANGLLAWRSWGISIWAWSFWSQKFLRKRATRLTATYSQMNAMREQLQRMKGPQCAWSIWGDVDQGVCMLETFPCSCYGALLARGHAQEPALTCLFKLLPIGFSLKIFVEAWLTCLWNGTKDLTFVKSPSL